MNARMAATLGSLSRGIPARAIPGVETCRRRDLLRQCRRRAGAADGVGCGQLPPDRSQRAARRPLSAEHGGRCDDRPRARQRGCVCQRAPSRRNRLRHECNFVHPPDQSRRSVRRSAASATKSSSPTSTTRPTSPPGWFWSGWVRSLSGGRCVTTAVCTSTI